MKPRTVRREQAAAAAMFRFMLIAVLLTALAFVVTLSAQAGDEMDLNTFFGVQQLSPGSQKLTYLTALAAVDYLQTVSTVVAHPDRNYEMNPLLGRHPRRGALAAFGLGGIAATALISRIDNPLARIVVDSIIATEQANVWENQYAMDRRTSMPVMVVFSFSY